MGWIAMTLAEVTGVAALILNVVIAVVGLTIGINKIKDVVRAEIEAHRKEFDDTLGIMRREFGETIQAIRQKVGDVELWGRDNYVKKDSFSVVTDRISREIKDSSDRIEKRMERVESKLDAQP